MPRLRMRALLNGRQPPPPRVPAPNRLLAALGDRECERLLPSLKLVSIRSRRVLQRQGDPARAVYFPNSGVASILTEMQDGRTVEVATVGREGMIGLSALFGGDNRAPESIVQVATGSAERMAVSAFRAEMQRRGALYDVVQRYMRRFMRQVTQSAACHGLHTVEQRCARWLLLTQDRLGKDEFRVTQDFLAILFGVRRSTVTVVLRSLQRRGMIEYRRRHVRIRHRRRLEAAACECYDILRGHLKSKA
jgi:CRP-like cAMP-binding protein